MGPESVEDLHDLSNAYLTPVQGTHQFANLSNGQTHHRAQGGDQTAQPHAQPSLPKHLCMEIHRRFVPLATLRTPAFENAMVRHFDWWWGWHIDHLSHARQADAAQAQLTIRTHHNPMLYDLCGNCALTPMIVLGITFLARLLLLCLRLFDIFFDECRRRRFLLFQFLNAGQGNAQVFLDLTQLFQRQIEGFS